MTMRWGFRVATRPEVGAGHILRCLALAEAMPAPVTIFTDPGHGWVGRIAATGCDEVCETEADGMTACTEAARTGAVDAVLVDGYGFHDADIRTVAATVFTAEIDDLLQPPRTAVVINPGADGDTAAYGSTRSLMLCGPRYALLGHRYAQAHAEACAAIPSEAVRSVLVSMGARDSADATSMAIDACRQVDRQMPVTVVMGRAATHLPKVRSWAESDPVLTLLVDHDDMASLYLTHDLAIGAGGVSLLERMCCGLPTIAVRQAANQRRNIDAAAAAGAVHDVGCPDTATATALAEALSGLISDHSRRNAMRNAGLAMVDGNGVHRVAERLQQACRDHLMQS